MKTIGKYEICGLLGKGGMSRVYKVKLPVIGKIAALKCLYPDPLIESLLGKKRIHELFIGEAKTLAAIRHQNVVAIWDYEEIDGRPCYLMDYYCNNLGILMGETYHTDAPSRIMPTERALHYTHQILDGIACLHHEGIVHRDIKPYNILVTDQDTAKICDFGLSKLRGETFTGPANLKIGSPWYMAPEQAADPDNIDAGADLYPIGVMLYRMLSGRLPERGYEPLSRINRDVDVQWDSLLTRALAPRPEDRFSTAEDMLHAVKTLARHWETQTARECRLPPPYSGNNHEMPEQEGTIALRRQAIKVSAGRARRRFALDPLWRPASYTPKQYLAGDDATVADKATGLVWQAAGSPYPLTWDRAHDYISGLNRRKSGGRSTWRFPTVSELTSLLTDIPFGRDHCLEPLFDRTQNRLWSSDRKSFTAAWYVSADLGFVHWQDLTCRNYVKAVASGA